MASIDREPRGSLLTRTSTRRELFKTAGRIAAIAAGTGIANRFGFLDLQPPLANADSSAANLTQLLKNYGSGLGVDAIGYRISNGWSSPDGFGYIGYQGAILQCDQSSGRVSLWNTLDRMHLMGLDAKLDNGSLGVTIPPHEDFNDGSNGDLGLAFRNRIEHFGIPSNVTAWVNNFRQKFETGAYTSRGKDYGAYTVYRLQRMAIQVWKENGLIQRSLIGEAAKAAGLIPQDVLLPRPDTDFQPAPSVSAITLKVEQVKSPKEIPQATNILTHKEFLTGIDESGNERFIGQFKGLMLDTARSCVREGGNWVVPSENYEYYYFSRDSFWVHAALRNKGLLDIAARRFHEDQKLNPNGQIATALYKGGERPNNRDRDEESTMMDVFREWERKRAGGTPDHDSLVRSYNFIMSHVANGRYVTRGETRSGDSFQGTNEIGTYHYWCDTFRPAGKAQATSEVITYNQGLLCIALESLQRLGINIDQSVLNQARNAYSNMVNPADGTSLPQREGSGVMDVSALVGEALSLYYFDTPILSRDHVNSTLQHLSRVNYPDGKFLGFKVISDYYGDYLPVQTFSGSSDNWPGNYQRGGSWFLYDILALYVGSRHQIPGSTDLFLQRLYSEIRRSWSSHEFIRTNSDLGGSDTVRNNYGWNTFVLNLLP